jgi:Fur family ferric uptake transcriptional regulator
MDDSLTEFSAILGSKGYRMTEARRAVLEALATARGHVSADDLVELVKEAGHEVGRMTVYRTLDLMTGLGLVRPVYQGTGAAHFVLLQNGHHHHLVCTKCHDVVEVESCVLADIESRTVADSEFEIHGHLLEIYGICQSCREP